MEENNLYRFTIYRQDGDAPSPADTILATLEYAHRVNQEMLNEMGARIGDEVSRKFILGDDDTALECWVEDTVIE